MKRDGDLFQRDFTQVPSYKKWNRRMKEMKKEERRKKKWEIALNFIGGIILLIVGWLLIIVFLTLK